MEFAGRDTAPLTDADLALAAHEIGCEPRAIKAVYHVEAPHGGFIADGRPTILFESHQFHKATNGQFDDSHPGLSTPTWVHNYGAGGAHQYDRLHEAMALNRDAALASTSWGSPQIMGSNFDEAGYDTLDEFVAAMCDSEASQLGAFVLFVQNAGLDQHLVDKDWPSFARGYNGPGQVFQYAEQIRTAYRNA